MTLLVRKSEQVNANSGVIYKYVKNLSSLARLCDYIINFFKHFINFIFVGICKKKVFYCILIG